MRQFVSVILTVLLLWTSGTLASEPDCAREHDKLNKEAQKRLSSSSDLGQASDSLIWLKEELSCHAKRRESASKKMKRIRFIAGMQIDMINTLDPKTLAAENCQERVLKVQSDFSGSLFADGEFSPHLDWIVGGVQKLCMSLQGSKSESKNRTPAKK